MFKQCKILDIDEKSDAEAKSIGNNQKSIVLPTRSNFSDNEDESFADIEQKCGKEPSVFLLRQRSIGNITATNDFKKTAMPYFMIIIVSPSYLKTFLMIPHQTKMASLKIC